MAHLRPLVMALISDATAFGRSLLGAADADAARTAINAATLLTPAQYGNGAGGDAAWTGWTYSEAGPLVARINGTIVGGRLRLTCTAGAGISPATEPHYELILPTALKSRAWRIRGRIATYTGGTTGSRWGLAVGNAGYAQSAALAMSPTGGPPIDGTGWVDLRVTEAGVLGRFGTGTTSVAPTAWTVSGFTTRATMGGSLPADLDRMVFFLQQYDTLAGTLTLELDHVSVGATEGEGW